MRALIILQSESEVLQDLGERIRITRLRANITQSGLAKLTGASLSSIRRLEAAGQGTLSLLVKVCFALQATEALAALFARSEATSIAELAAQAEQPQRQRARTKGQQRTL